MFASSLLAAAPVVDIDGTFFVQGGIYLALVFLLNPLLFKPWLEARARRTEAIDGSVRKAKALRSDADALAAKYDERLEAARERAHEARSKSRRDEEAKQAEAIASARSVAQTELDAARKKAAGDAERARGALQGRVEELASQISAKLIGRAS